MAAPGHDRGWGRGWDHGRDRTVQFIDWEHPERNDFLVVNQFRVDEPGGQGHKFIAPDLVLFVNGIPLVVIEAKSPTVVEPMVKAIRQFRRYASQRGLPEGNERLVPHQSVRGGDVLREGPGWHVHRGGRAFRGVEDH